MPPAQPTASKWDAIIAQVDRTEELSQKVSLLATMMKMIAVNDLQCLEERIDALSSKFDTCMKKIYAIGVVIAALVFTGVDIKTIVDLILRVAQ